MKYSRWKKLSEYIYLYTQKYWSSYKRRKSLLQFSLPEDFTLWWLKSVLISKFLDLCNATKMIYYPKLKLFSSSLRYYNSWNKFSTPFTMECSFTSGNTDERSIFFFKLIKKLYIFHSWIKYSIKKWKPIFEALKWSLYNKRLFSLTKLEGLCWLLFCF